MGFVQVIEFETSDIEGMRQLGKEWEAASAGQSTATRRVVCADRDRPGRYLNIVFFDSYESAMQNSGLPVTQEYADKMGAITENRSFRNLDVIEDTDRQ